MFDITKRDEHGLLVYDHEAVRNFCTEKENALEDEFMEKFNMIFERHERGEISDEEYERLAELLDDEHTAACERLYDGEFGTQAADNVDEKFFAPPSFATA